MLMGVTLSAVMIITPKMAALLLQGVVPVSDAIQSFIQKSFLAKEKFISEWILLWELVVLLC